MAVYYNLKGTTQDQFQIGKGGVTIHQGTSTPTGVDGDFWLDPDGELKVRLSGTWDLIYTDLTTAQTVAGAKTWSDVAVFNSNVTINDPNTAGKALSIVNATESATLEILGANNKWSGIDLGINAAWIGYGDGSIGEFLDIWTDGAILDLHSLSSSTPNDFVFKDTDGTALLYDYSASEWDFQSKDITTTGDITATQLHSTVTTGTAPFTVASSTLVTNLNADQLDGISSANFLRSNVADIMYGTLTMSASITSDDYANRIKKMTVLQSGYIETTPTNFRFDQDCIRYVNRWGTATITETEFSDFELDVLFSRYASNDNLYGKADPCSIEITGLSISSTASNAFYPYIFLHSNNNAVNVKMEVEKSGDPGVWEEAFDGSTSTYKIAEYSSGTGILTGVRWTFDTIASPTYIRSLGVISRNGDGYAWNVMKGGDTMYGDLTFGDGYAASDAEKVTATTSTAASDFKVPFLNTTISTTDNYGLLQDSTATLTYNPSTNTLTAVNFEGLAANATRITATVASANVEYKMPFLNTIISTTDEYPMLQDAGSFTFNPSTTTLTATNFAGNASTATAWATTRTIDLSGDITSDAVNIDGTGNITITNTVVSNDSHTHDANNLTGTTLASGVVASSLTSVGTLTALDVDNINLNGNTISTTAGTDLYITPLAGEQLILSSSNTATSGTINSVSITPTYNQTSGTAANTDLYINRTETDIGSGTQYLINAAVGGTSRFNVENDGDAYISDRLKIGTTDAIPTSVDTMFYMKGSGTGTPGRTELRVENTSSTSGSRIHLGSSDGGYISLQVTSSGYSIGASAGFGSNLDMVFGTDGGVASGGTHDIIFKTGGYLTSQQFVKFTSDKHVKIFKDSSKLYFGEGDDCSITYDGTDMVFDSQEVGSGDFVFNNGDVVATTFSGNATSATTLSATLGETLGGTGLTTYATGDILYASAANTLSKLTAGTDTHVLTLSGGVPVWAAGGGGGADLQDVTDLGSTTDNAISITNTTASTSVSTGSLIIDGGVGIDGDVHIGASMNAITKSFLIDHPTKPNKKLRHGSLEGPEHAVYTRGRLTGCNRIELPEYWSALVNPDTITVNLTAIGKAQDLYVEEMLDGVIVVGNGLFHKKIDCFYTIFAERADVDKLKVEE